jgi:threonine aldolase
LNEIEGLQIDLDSVETNMVYVDHSRLGMSTDEVLNRLKAVGVLASGRPPRQIRLVTHRHYGKPEIQEALHRIGTSLGAK